MTALFRSIAISHRVARRGAAVIAVPRVNRRRSIHLAATAAQVALTAGEILFFLWTLLVLAFSFLIIAGFFA